MNDPKHDFLKPQPGSGSAGSDYEWTDPTLRMQIAAKQAASKGCYIRTPKSNELFVDIDSEDHYATFQVAYPRLAKIFEGASHKLTASPSKKPNHYHIVVTLPRLIKSTEERIFLQLLLGSDPLRELISYERVIKKAEEPTLFFEKLPETP